MNETCGHGSVLSDDHAICYVLPVLGLTSRFHIMQILGRIKDDGVFSLSSPGGSIRGKVTGYDCRLVLVAE